mgnify:CR=1 FL=1
MMLNSTNNENSRVHIDGSGVFIDDKKYDHDEWQKIRKEKGWDHYYEDYTKFPGLNIVFDFAWNMFKGCEKTEVNIGEKLSNDIMIFRGLILYSRIDGYFFYAFCLKFIFHIWN